MQASILDLWIESGEDGSTGGRFDLGKVLAATDEGN